MSDNLMDWICKTLPTRTHTHMLMHANEDTDIHTLAPHSTQVYLRMHECTHTHLQDG